MNLYANNNAANSGYHLGERSEDEKSGEKGDWSPQEDDDEGRPLKESYSPAGNSGGGWSPASGMGK